MLMTYTVRLLLNALENSDPSVVDEAVDFAHNVLETDQYKGYSMDFFKDNLLAEIMKRRERLRDD